MPTHANTAEEEPRLRNLASEDCHARLQTFNSGRLLALCATRTLLTMNMTRACKARHACMRCCPCRSKNHFEPVPTAAIILRPCI
eukprot:358859-Chlamydomonas_euryale.AAC.13